MVNFISVLLLFVLSVFFFFRENRLERKRAAKNHHLGNEHILREIERFLKERN